MLVRNVLLSCLACWLAVGSVVAAERPNVILIMTDDQGYGDIGAHGNPIIKTPHLDQFAGESVEVDPFYVSPVCSPTRASLMTGRWSYRTGVTDTFGGRATMRSSETTLAEILREAGWRTGIFGKWHLGDCYPFRPMDQGFQESLVHRGGILGAGDDPPGTSYFNPILQHNGKPQPTKGYCADVFTDAAIEFIKSHRDEPFFAYIPYNTPHSPFQIAENYVTPYAKLQLKPADFPAAADPVKISSHTVSAYGMITNIDDNLGRLFRTIDDLGVRDNTMVIFLTDNGPNGLRYRAGFRKYKGSAYEGGIRTMFYVRWPAALKAEHKITQVCAHIDVLPTIAEACGVSLPEDLHIDGRSFLPLLKQQQVAWPDRNLYFQWHRGQKPTPYLGFALRGPRYKLLHTGSSQDGPTFTTPARVPQEIPFELYDLQTDPYETQDIAADHAEIVASMRADYDSWLAEVMGAQDFAPPSIIVGTPHENPTVLTRQDFADGWTIGVEKPGQFEIVGSLPPAKTPRTVHLKVQGRLLHHEVAANATRFQFSEIDLETSPASKIQIWTEQGDGRRQNITYVHVRRTSGD
jgi:arylsulfatase A-like enzyme